MENNRATPRKNSILKTSAVPYQGLSQNRKIIQNNKSTSPKERPKSRPKGTEEELKMRINLKIPGIKPVLFEKSF